MSVVGGSTDFLLLSAGGVPTRSPVSQKPSIADCAEINVLEMDPLLVVSVIRLRRHGEGSEVVTLMGKSLGNGQGLGVHNRADQLEWMKKREETDSTMREMGQGITSRSASEPDGGGDVRGGC